MKPKRELGSYPADFEPYFLMWDSVLFFPDANTSNIPLYGDMDEIGSIPCYQHRSCGALVKLTDKYPKRVCPHCGVDTLQEYKEQKAREEENGERTPQLYLP